MTPRSCSCPKALGYASGGQILQAWQRIADAYGAIDNAQERMREGRLVLDRARAVSAGYLPYLEGTGRAGREDEWHQAAQAALDSIASWRILPPLRRPSP